VETGFDDCVVGSQFDIYYLHHPVRCFGVLQRPSRKARYFVSAQTVPVSVHEERQFRPWSPVPKFPFLARFAIVRGELSRGLI
jgi:hypothetical protein